MARGRGDTRIAYVVKVVRKYRWKRTALVKGAVCPNRFFLCKLKPGGLCADFDVVLYEGFHY